MTHGKANALDIEFCEALAAQFRRAAHVRRQGRRADRAGHDLFRRRRSKRLSAGGADYVASVSAGAARSSTTRCSFTQAGDRGDQRPRHGRRRVLACLRRPPHHGARAGRIGVTEMLVGVPFPALAFEIVRFAVPPRYLTRVHAERRDLSDRRGAGAKAGSTRWSSRTRCWSARMAVAQVLCGAVAGGLRADQGADPPAGERAHGAKRRGDRQGGDRNLDRAGNAGARRRLCGEDACGSKLAATGLATIVIRCRYFAHAGMNQFRLRRGGAVFAAWSRGLRQPLDSAWPL